MSERDDRPADDLDDRQHAIDEIVELQRRMVRRWSKYAVRYVGHVQSGNFDVSTYLDAYGELATGTADDLLRSLDVLTKLRGAW